MLLGAPDVVWDDAIACVPLVGPYSDAAFVIQPVHTAFLGYTFVHEIGHLFGCNHQFGSAWRNCCGLGRTLNLGPGVTVNSIMKGGRDVIPYFTDPEIEYLGVSTGSFNPNSGRMDNNAGRIRTNSCIVSSFIESTQPFASISLQRSNCQIFASSLYNTVVENDDSYSFEWFLTLEGEFLPDNLDSYISLGEGEEIFITDNQVGDPCVNYFIHLAVMRYQQVIFHQSEIIKGGICTDNVWCGPEGEDSEIKSKTDLDSDIHLSNSTIQSIEYYDLYGSPVLTLKDEDIIGFSRKVNYLKGVIIRIVNFSDGTRSTSKHIYLNR